LGIYRTGSFVVGVLAIIAGVVLACQTLGQASRVPFLSLFITLALPFVACHSAIWTGEMLGFLMEVRDRVEHQSSQPIEPLTKSIRELTQEVRVVKEQLDAMRREAANAAKPPAPPAA
jgi:hypothetical protein